MSVTSWKFAQTAANVDRDNKQSWTNVLNAKADDGNYAWCIPDKDTYSDWLRLTNFGFSAADVPAGATITGIEVEIRRVATGVNQIKDSALFLRDKNAAQAGDNKASAVFWTTSWGAVTYGGAADAWNASLNQEDIINSNFGIDISISMGDTNTEGRIDYIKIRIHYSRVANPLFFGCAF